MTKSGKQDTEDSQPSQQFDTTLKDWLRQAAASVLSILLPGAVYTETLTIELIRPTIRADKVFKITYEAIECIFHIEFESGSDTYMASRMNAYNAILYNDYHIPVISMVIYPFRTTMATSPLEVSVSSRDITTFHFLTLPLYTMEAEQYVRNHMLSMYPLLPTMKGANRAVIKQAVDELTELYREDEVTLAQQIIWMELLLERTDTVPLPEKQRIQEELKMYDPLWEENSKVRRMRAESMAEGEAKGKAEGLAEGLAEGEAKGLQMALVSAVKVRFPELTELAQQTVVQINDTTGLDMLLKHVITAPDERTARWLLSSAA